MTQVLENDAVIIDDNLMTASRMASQLRAAGYAVNFIQPAALHEQVNNGPDVIVINYGPYSNDFSAAAALTASAHALFPSSKILGYVSHGLVADLKRVVMPAGCNLLAANSVASSRLPALLSRLQGVDRDNSHDDDIEA